MISLAEFEALLNAPQPDLPAIGAAFLDRYSIEKGGPEAPLRLVNEWILRGWPDPVDPTKQATPDPWQEQVLLWYGEGQRQISVRSGHSVGKSAVLAWICIHQILTRFPQKTAITAPNGRQLFDVLYPEILMWIQRLPTFLSSLLECKSETIELRASPAASFLTAKTSRPETPEALAGIHSTYVLLIADEASGIPEPVFEAASGSMASHNATTILCGNPVRTSGLFFDTHHKLRAYWKTLHVDCHDCRRVPQAYIDEMARRYGINSNAFRVRVLGEFPKAGLKSVIPYELAVLAVDRDIRPNPQSPVSWGIDVARQGDDRSTLAKRRGGKLLEKVKYWRLPDLMQLASVIKAEWDLTATSDRPSEILIDSIGMGAGLVDRLRQLGLPVLGVNVSENAAMSEQFANLKAELWFMARDWFQRLDCSMPEDEDFLAELVAVDYDFTKKGDGKIIIEDKKAVTQKLGFSPDLAEAFILTFGGVAAMLVNGGQNMGWGQPLKRNIKGATTIVTKAPGLRSAA